MAGIPCSVCTLSTAYQDEKNDSEYRKPACPPLRRSQTQYGFENIATQTVRMEQHRQPFGRPQPVDRRLQRIATALDPRMRDDPQLIKRKSHTGYRNRKGEKSTQTYPMCYQPCQSTQTDDDEGIPLQYAKRTWQHHPEELKIQCEQDEPCTQQRDGYQDISGFHNRFIQPR